MRQVPVLVHTAAGVVVLVRGRESELQLLTDLLQPGNDAAGVLLHGEAGIGKSRLLEQVVGLARPERLVLVSRACASEADLPYVGLADLLGGVPADVLEPALAGLPAPQRTALEVALLQRTEPSTGQQVLAVHLAVLHVLRQVAVEHRLLVVLDDALWLDPESAAALAFAARRACWPVLAAARTEAAAP